MDRSGRRVAIVIPALNESSSIEPVVAQAGRYGLPIVVDDGSSDPTAEVAARAGAEVVSHPINRGYDAALNSGFARASALGCEVVITMDADGQHNPELLARFIELLDQGADVAVGVRDRRQRLAEHVFALFGKKFWHIDDPLCGMKAYRMAVYRALGHFDSYNSVGTELAVFAARQGYKVAQLPVKTRDRVGMPRFGRRLQGNWRIFRALCLTLVRAA